MASTKISLNNFLNNPTAESFNNLRLSIGEKRKAYVADCVLDCLVNEITDGLYVYRSMLRKDHIGCKNCPLSVNSGRHIAAWCFLIHDIKFTSSGIEKIMPDLIMTLVKLKAWAEILSEDECVLDTSMRGDLRNEWGFKVRNGVTR